MIVSACDQFCFHGGSEHLLDFVSLGVINERRNGNGPDLIGKLNGVTGGVITASSAANANQHCPARQPALHWIFPFGRLAAMVSAHSTAVDAAIRRLSEAAHNQKLFALFASGTMDNNTSPCPAAFTLVGASSARRVMFTCSPASACENVANSMACSNSTWTAKACRCNIWAC